MLATLPTQPLETRQAVAPPASGTGLDLDLAVVIPTFNEAANIEPLLRRLDVALKGVSWEAIFVDDNSQDGTASLVRRLGRANPRLRVLQRIGRRGLSSAVIEGMMATSAPVLAVIDADMQHDETLLPRLFEAVRNGENDLAIGSRYVDGGGVGDWNTDRQVASLWATRLARNVVGTELSDPMSGFFVISRDALEEAIPRLSGTGFKILLDIVASAPRRLRLVELPYVFRSRVAGESKLDLLVSGEYLKLLLDKTVGRFVPTRLIMFMAVGSLGLGVHLGLLGMLIATGLVSFAFAQAAAVWGAMTFNFVLNNAFTYRDRRLKGFRFVTGMLSFYAVCLIGAVANVGVGSYLYDMHRAWWVAGIAGAVVGTVWNYVASSAVTWRSR